MSTNETKYSRVDQANFVEELEHEARAWTWSHEAMSLQIF